MALPNPVLTKIPDNEPDAVPGLWNITYEEIDENFGNHETRMTSAESDIDDLQAEIQTARGGQANLDARIDDIEADIVTATGNHVQAVDKGGTGLTSVAQGDLLYGSAENVIAKLVKSTEASRFIKNSGTNNNPIWGPIAAGDMPSGIDAAKLGNGAVSNDEFQCLDGVTAALQGQLDGKAATTHVQAVDKGGTGLTSVAQGDLLYGSAANEISVLAKSASPGQYLKNTGPDNSPVWAPPELLRGFFSNLTIKNNATTPNTQLDISADGVVMRDASGNLKYFNAPSGTVNALASGAGGLDNGTFTAATWYYPFFIGKADGTVSTLLSTSSTSPSLPSGYIYWKLLSAVYATTGPRFVKVSQYGDRVVLLEFTQTEITHATASWTSKTLASVPPIACTAMLQPSNTSNTIWSASIAWDSSGVDNRITHQFPTSGILMDGYYNISPMFDYQLNPAAPQTVYMRCTDASQRDFACRGYRVKI